MKFASMLTVLMSVLNAWDYKEHGNDWPDKGYANCKQTQKNPQSPIDLPFNLPGMGSVRWASED
jgi:hypothetical protein